MKGVFVTGTDTGVGKTVVSAALLLGLRPLTNVCYWKPMQTGAVDDDDTRTVRSLTGATPGEIHEAGFRMSAPLSPHLAAEIDDIEISVEAAIKFVPFGDDRFWIIEGAGGVLVPLNDDELMTDLMVELKLPVVVVARTVLGTINHTLMTLRTLRSEGLAIAGVVMNGEPNAENRQAIEHFGNVNVIAEVPRFVAELKPMLYRWAAGHADQFSLLVRS